MKIHKIPKPAIVRQLGLFSSVWIVGSTAKAFATGKCETQPRDYDIIVTDAREWNKVQLLFANLETTVNSFGGIKVLDEKADVDIWFAQLSDFMCRKAVVSMYNPLSGTYWEKS